MKRQASGTDTVPATEKSMSLIGLLFFLLGAFHLYSFFQGQKSQETGQANSQLAQWLATGLLTTAMLGLMEILVS